MTHALPLSRLETPGHPARGVGSLNIRGVGGLKEGGVYLVGRVWVGNEPRKSPVDKTTGS